jgi:hypothetical protein
MAVCAQYSTPPNAATVRSRKAAVWLAPNLLAKLQMLRRPSESYSDVMILALAGR